MIGHVFQARNKAKRMMRSGTKGDSVWRSLENSWRFNLCLSECKGEVDTLREQCWRMWSCVYSVEELGELHIVSVDCWRSWVLIPCFGGLWTVYPCSFQYWFLYPSIGFQFGHGIVNLILSFSCLNCVNMDTICSLLWQYKADQLMLSNTENRVGHLGGERD